MRVQSCRDLDRRLARAGVDREAMTWTAAAGQACVLRLLVREAEADTVEAGPHRPIHLPDERRSLKVRVGDRPALSGLVAALMARAGAMEVCAAGAPGAYWLNNRGYAARLAPVPDAQRLHAFLRGVGLTDRFRGGFLVRPHEFDSHLPRLASQPFCGGPDVLFAAEGAPLLILACHEFDLHVETRDPALADIVRAEAAERGLPVRGAELTSESTDDADGRR